MLELLVTAAALAVAAFMWPHLPALIPTHWDAHMRVNGYSPRWAIFLVGPGSMAATMLLTAAQPWLSPRRFSVDAFQATYRRVMLILFALVTWLYALMFWSALGHRVDAGRTVLGGICLFIALIGNLMGKVRRNFFIGVRTPWTLANERVWNATHRFAAKTFVAGGLVGLALTIVGLNGWALAGLLTGALAPVVYSLVNYKQLERRGELSEPLLPG
ncbi:MAG TPA: SdpI family protein [Rhizomicrobium sp.]